MCIVGAIRERRITRKLQRFKRYIHRERTRIQTRRDNRKSYYYCYGFFFFSSFFLGFGWNISKPINIVIKTWQLYYNSK